MASSNPAMNPSVYERAGFVDVSTNAMTLGGTVIKTGILLIIMLVSAGITWTQVANGSLETAYGLMIAGVIGGLITSLITIFIPRCSPISAPIYAALEGLFLGALSAFIEMRYPGIALQALGLTASVLAIMLFVYGTGMIRATQKFRIGVVAATGAIFLVYLVSMVVSVFGGHVPYIHDAGPIGIIFSLVVVVIAALNLILDFDFIEQGVRHQVPKYMEWYGGFSLLLTLVWMYLEILRLLSKLRANRG
jgi:uncharacterized YccA/Bax inhibitor family protein